MGKLLSEGLFDSIVGLLMKGKINKGVEQLKKDPILKKAMNDYQDSTSKLKQSLSDYEEKHGADNFSKGLKDLRSKRYGG